MHHSDLKPSSKNFPADVILKLPNNSKLPESDLHYLLYIPWNDSYLEYVPAEHRDFFQKILPYLSARTTDVHTAICMSYLDEFCAKFEALGEKPNRNVVAYALLLHDSGWSQMSEEEIASSLGVKGLALSTEALAPKQKHALLGEQIAREILTMSREELGLSEEEIELICRAILFHDKPEEVAGSQKEMPLEVKILVDLDHIWSFTHLNFWQDTQRKGVEPKEYLENLKADLPTYFVTEVGKAKADELWSEREKEVLLIAQ
jgi:hypothetical protein